MRSWISYHLAVFSYKPQSSWDSVSLPDSLALRVWSWRQDQSFLSFPLQGAFQTKLLFLLASLYYSYRRYKQCWAHVKTNVCFSSHKMPFCCCFANLGETTKTLGALLRTWHRGDGIPCQSNPVPQYGLEVSPCPLTKPEQLWYSWQKGWLSTQRTKCYMHWHLTHPKEGLM